MSGEGKPRFKPRTPIRQQPSLPPTCLLLGSLRAVRGQGKGDIRTETTKDHPEGEGLLVCRVAKERLAEARAIVAAPPFVAFGRAVATEGLAYRLFSGVAVEFGISAGHAAAMAAAYDRALGPGASFQGSAPGPANELKPA